MMRKIIITLCVIGLLPASALAAGPTLLRTQISAICIMIIEDLPVVPVSQDFDAPLSFRCKMSEQALGMPDSPHNLDPPLFRHFLRARVQSSALKPGEVTSHGSN